MFKEGGLLLLSTVIIQNSTNSVVMAFVFDHTYRGRVCIFIGKYENLTLHKQHAAL